MADWIKFKSISEVALANVSLEKNVWGFQQQKGTKWNAGLSEDDIQALEDKFGFKFPTQYVEMLKTINGFDTEHISIYPDGIASDEFQRRCYKYPDDFENVQWVIEMANQYLKYAKGALEEDGITSNDIEGFVPLYGHRALVVFKDKSLSPVLSIWGNDIVVYGKSLKEYWCNEFYIDF